MSQPKVYPYVDMSTLTLDMMIGLSRDKNRRNEELYGPSPSEQSENILRRLQNGDLIYNTDKRPYDGNHFPPTEGELLIKSMMEAEIEDFSAKWNGKDKF